MNNAPPWMNLEITPFSDNDIFHKDQVINFIMELRRGEKHSIEFIFDEIGHAVNHVKLIENEKLRKQMLYSIALFFEHHFQNVVEHG